MLDGPGENKKMKKFELKIFMKKFDKYDGYVGGPVVVICNGVNITKHDDSKSISIVIDYYFNVFENWLKCIPKILTSTDEVICHVLDSPYNFVFRRKDSSVEVSVHHYVLGSEFDKKMGGRGKPIEVPLGDFVKEILDTANYFINVMLEKNPSIADETEFKNIIKRKKEGEKEWIEYLKRYVSRK